MRKIATVILGEEAFAQIVLLALFVAALLAVLIHTQSVNDDRRGVNPPVAPSR